MHQHVTYHADVLAEAQVQDMSNILPCHEDSQGPAVFQGFQPPPCYAWSATHIDVDKQQRQQQQRRHEEEEDGDASPNAVVCTPPLPERPVPKSLRAASPLNGYVAAEETLPPELAFREAMNQLICSQNACTQLRLERRGVPAEEVERWCASIAEHLAELHQSFHDKIDTYKKTSDAKDETIRRLHRKLQMAETRAGSSTADAEPDERVERVERVERAERADRVERVNTTPATGSTGMVGSVRRANSGDEKMRLSLRKEVANMRRREPDLAAQLRAREIQVEQLTTTLRELQTVTQRQISLYKRQLQVKDNSLQVMQEELVQQSPGTHIPSASSYESIALPSDTVTDNERRMRRPAQNTATASSSSVASPLSAGAKLRTSRLFSDDSERRLHRADVPQRMSRAPQATAAASISTGTVGQSSAQSVGNKSRPTRHAIEDHDGRTRHQDERAQRIPKPLQDAARDRSLGPYPAPNQNREVASSPTAASQHGSVIGDGATIRRKTSQPAVHASSPTEDHVNAGRRRSDAETKTARPRNGAQTMRQPRLPS